MSSIDQPLSSNNPFRPATDEKPRKIVKKVRVQSPPPSSPEDAVPVTRLPPQADSDDESDPFALDHHDQQSQTPPNPFARTLHDIEPTTAPPPPDSTTTTTTRGALDVNAFKQLLLTGYANIPTPLPHLPVVAQDGASNTDASSIQDTMLETPRTSHDISDPEPPTVSSASARKKPPPPSSRHGKLIKIELRPSNSQPETSPLTDVNKPLPAPPLRALADEDTDSPFDREAAGKVPEAFAGLQANPRPPTPPPTSRHRSASQGSVQSIKPAAPPPRRHRRSESTKPDEDPPLRSSIESTRSRTDSLRISERTSHPPAPPPPRRPPQKRNSSSYMAASNPSPALSPDLDGALSSPASFFSPLTSQTLAAEAKDGSLKLSPPPPPPARKPSTRRPASIRSVESSNSARKVSKEKDGGAMAPPPPPPPRARGSGRPALGPPASSSGDATDDYSLSAAVDTSGKQGEEILADLDALQREVDEMMKRATTSN
ncbi:hypothetical protein F5Y16DRAFT_174330 [Xylariaceae sp. FL0255]|nr:hypothetical protein F5Y16DRAFT_174330 [Xylariaceae sp. FL0255]